MVFLPLESLLNLVNFRGMAHDDRPGLVLVKERRQILVPDADEVSLGHRHDLFQEIRSRLDPQSPVRPVNRLDIFP